MIYEIKKHFSVFGVIFIRHNINFSSSTHGDFLRQNSKNGIPSDVLVDSDVRSDIWSVTSYHMTHM